MTSDLMELPGLFDRKGRNIEADLSTLLAYLRGRGWRTAKEIAAHQELGFSDRYTRAIAQHSKGQIISGDLGYKYKNMIKRAIDADRVWHSGRVA